MQSAGDDRLSFSFTCLPQMIIYVCCVISTVVFKNRLDWNSSETDAEKFESNVSGCMQDLHIWRTCCIIVVDIRIEKTIISSNIMSVRVHWAFMWFRFWS